MLEKDCWCCQIPNPFFPPDKYLNKTFVWWWWLMEIKDLIHPIFPFSQWCWVLLIGCLTMELTIRLFDQRERRKMDSKFDNCRHQNCCCGVIIALQATWYSTHTRLWQKYLGGKKKSIYRNLWQLGIINDSCTIVKR